MTVLDEMEDWDWVELEEEPEEDWVLVVDWLEVLVDELETLVVLELVKVVVLDDMLVVDLLGPTKLVGSKSAGRGVCEKSNEFIMSLAAATRGVLKSIPNTVSVILMSEANSYCVSSM